MFTHLHLHTHFSFGIGASSPETLVQAAVRRGFTSLACTDTNGVYGAVEFQQAAESAGIRPILGAVLSTEDEETVALAMDERGWAGLCRAITELRWAERRKDGKAEGRVGGPPASPPVRLSACLQNHPGLILLSRDVRFLERIVASSGPENVCAALVPGKQRHAVLAAARRLGIPPVATNAVVMANPEDWPRHRLLRAISRNTTLSSLPASSLSPREAWLRPAADLARFFPDCPEALTNAEAVADRCRYRIPFGRVVPPRLAEHADALAQLRALAYEGAQRRYGTVAPITRDRLEHELAIIGMKGFADYFLVVRDIVQHGPTHCGRGSVANSVVSYCLGITHVEPHGAGLLFERFLNPERKDPPDIDLDFPWDERDKVLAYVFQRYPHPRAAMVSNHNCFRLRGALREVAKVHGRPPGEIREVTRRIPWYNEEASLPDLMHTHPNFRALELPAVWRDLAALAEPLIGVPRHLSLHPGGVVIAPDALTDYVPIEIAAKQLDGFPDLPVPVIQFEKDGAEDAGLVKIDLLGNRSLAVIRDAIAAVHTHTGRQIDYTSMEPGDDEKTRALFRTGQTMGVFYTESPASRLLCQKSHAETFDLLVLNTSIIRPASNRYIRTYLERLHGKPYEPLAPCLQDVLSDTFGVMVYQEDVVNVCATFAGMPLATGDGLRKALSKKRPHKRLATYAEEFFAGAAALGRDGETAKKVWEMVMSFAGYSFCKGHSCSYIQVAQHSCYLRANYPAEFIAAVLSNGGGFYHPFAYVADALRLGLTVLPPDINESTYRCWGRDGVVRIGFQFVKGLSSGGLDKLETGRTAGRSDGPTGRRSDGQAVRRSDGPTGGRAGGQAGGRDGAGYAPYRSIEDLRRRTGLGNDDLRILIKVGALDSIAQGRTRPMMLWEVDSDGKAEGRKGGTRAPALAIGQNGFEGDRPSFRPSVLPSLREYSAARRRKLEYELLGFTTEGHPMDLFEEQLSRYRVVRSPDLARHVGRHVLCAGLLTTSKPVHTVKDEPMEFATFDDGKGLIETVLFPDVYRERGHVLFDPGPFLFRGKVEEEFGAVTVTITHLDRVRKIG